jgi:hypothetical protein
MKRFALIGAVLGVFVLGVIISADILSIDFEPPEYSLGTIDGQEGWAGTLGGPINPVIDQAVVNNMYGYASFDLQSWRISNFYTNGSFGDWPFSPSLANEAGETQAQNGIVYSGGVRQKHFEVQWDFASTTPGSVQVAGCVDPPGVPQCLQISTSPDRGDGARMSFIRMKDRPAGLSVEFADYKDSAPYGSYGSLASAAAGCGLEDDFVITTVASGLNSTRPHTIRLTMDFVDGPRNDRVKVYVDGTLRHTGGSWEDYYRWCLESGGGTGTTTFDQSRTVDSMIFQARTGGGTAPGIFGKGFLIDNLTLLSSQGPKPKVTGGGQVMVTGGKGTFGFNAKPDAGTASGHLNYMNHVTGAHLDCTVTAFSELTAMTAKFSGTCSPNSFAQTFKAEVEDNDEPGAGADMFKINYPSSNPISEGGTLTSGNIQIK